jgi:hypothetical protein
MLGPVRGPLALSLANAAVHLIAVATAAGCGARASLVLDEAGPGAPGSCEAWAPLEPGPAMLSEPSGGYGEPQLFVEGDRVFVAFNEVTNPKADARSEVRTLTHDLSSAESAQTVFTDAYVQSMASGFGHRGALGQIGVAGSPVESCVFQALGDDGAPIGDRTTLYPSCQMVGATRDGYVVIAREPHDSAPGFPPGTLGLFLLDESGAVIHQSDLGYGSNGAVFTGGYADGSALVIWGEVQGLEAQRYSEQGVPLGEVQKFGSWFRAAAGWMDGTSGLLTTASGNMRDIDVRVIEPGGTVSEPATTISTPGEILDIALAVSGGGAILVWTRLPAGSHDLRDVVLEAQPITMDGTIDGDPLNLTLGPAPTYLVNAAGTPRGAAVVYRRRGDIYGRALCHE